MFENKKVLVAIPACNTVIIPVVVTIVCLVPFVGKAFHIDDPLFIWAANQIQTSPADFYGFMVNWYGTEMPMSEVTKNPPGTCYYIALAGWLFGFSEIALHIAFLVPAVAVALGTYYLARQFCSRPVLAALAAVLTPGFLVSSTNIMCDTMMLASWVWAVFLWVRGVKEDKQLNLFLAAVLIAICALTKYVGIALLGLLFVYSLIQKRKLGRWALFLLVPIAILVVYQLATHSLYGSGAISSAVSFTTRYRWMGSVELFSKALTGLAFFGGCMLTIVLYGPLLWSRRVLVGGVVLTILFIFALTFAERIGSFSIHNANGIRWGFLIQFSLMAMTGVSILGLAVADFKKCRNADSLLLLLWVLGTFIFASFINWVVNVRSVLPIVVAVGILLMRRIDQRCNAGQRIKIWRTIWPLHPAALIALLVTWADYTWANTARSAAVQIHDSVEEHGATVCFQGHWGFQYYMEANGHKAFDFKHSKPVAGDIIIIPSNNCFIGPLPEKTARLTEVFNFVPCRWLATMETSLGAGFYAGNKGPLPFAIGPVDPEKYYAFIIQMAESKVGF